MWEEEEEEEKGVLVLSILVLVLSWSVIEEKESKAEWVKKSKGVRREREETKGEK